MTTIFYIYFETNVLQHFSEKRFEKALPALSINSMIDRKRLKSCPYDGRQN